MLQDLPFRIDTMLLGPIRDALPIPTLMCYIRFGPWLAVIGAPFIGQEANIASAHDDLAKGVKTMCWQQSVMSLEKLSVEQKRRGWIDQAYQHVHHHRQSRNSVGSSRGGCIS